MAREKSRGDFPCFPGVVARSPVVYLCAGGIIASTGGHAGTFPRFLGSTSVTLGGDHGGFLGGVDPSRRVPNNEGLPLASRVSKASTSASVGVVTCPRALRAPDLRERFWESVFPSGVPSQSSPCLRECWKERLALIAVPSASPPLPLRSDLR